MAAILENLVRLSHRYWQGTYCVRCGGTVPQESEEHTTMKEALLLTAVFFALIAGIVAETREIHEAVVCGTIGCRQSLVEWII
jgi:hypothetical protein